MICECESVLQSCHSTLRFRQPDVWRNPGPTTSRAPFCEIPQKPLGVSAAARCTPKSGASKCKDKDRCYERAGLRPTVRLVLRVGLPKKQKTRQEHTPRVSRWALGGGGWEVARGFPEPLWPDGAATKIGFPFAEQTSLHLTCDVRSQFRLAGDGSEDCAKGLAV